ncbi:MAG: pyridoxamine 5'-phosphate oxidase [Chloroflexi bacterium]|nr:pyridoxamine 5'-phosphate oxidase [Chloroflexota bacterium]
MTTFSNMRTEYPNEPLDLEHADADPFAQFANWLQAAIDANHVEANAMSLATATANGMPSARMVLLKGFDRQGFVFFTNYNSRKATEIAENPNAALCFYWDKLSRQVRAEGTVEKIAAADSDAYFVTRPRDSQIATWVSEQSTVVESRATLDEGAARIIEQFEGQDIPRPPHWGGYRVKPFRFEFWQGRPGRLHDRIAYSLQDDNSWKIQRLAP